MVRNASVWMAVLAAAVTSCAAANPFRLEDQIAVFHDDLRWGRLPAAEQQVAPAARPNFARRHAQWGRAVRIVDVEMEGTRVSGLIGVARAHYTWTRAQDVSTRETVIETRWHAGMDGNWIIEDERVISGDATMLALR